MATSDVLDFLTRAQDYIKQAADRIRSASDAAVPQMPPIPPQPPQPPQLPEDKYKFDGNGMLIGGRSSAYGFQIDPVVGPDCPNTVYLPKTGHVLSIPRPDRGEMMMGYATRVSDQAKLPIGWLFKTVYNATEAIAKDPSRWPEHVDSQANPQMYA